MHFSFKRPNTSKSVSALYRDNKDAKSIPKTIQSILRPPKEEIADPNARWKQAAQKINKEMVLHRALQTNTQPFRMLSKMGGQVFASQPKLNHSQSGSKMRVRITSKEKRVQDRKEKQGTKTQQTLKLFQSGIGDSKLKRRKRNEHFGLGLQQELKTANIFYESPVIKIGFNMQFQSYLKFQHIDQIRPDHGGNICRNSMIFFLKDAPFSPNIISEKNTEIPIALSLFPQFFDSKLSLSTIKRRKYLQNLLQQMNSTYDPERMAALPRFSSYPAFNDLKYKELTQNLVTSCQKNYKSQWLENILKIVKIKPSQIRLKQILSQQWDFFNRAMAMITLDYVLKNPQMLNKLKVSPYLPTRVITAKRILYHGGYCRSIYTSWSQYVQNGRKRLSTKLKKYNQITQAIHGWYSHFQNIQLFQSDFPHLLPESISVGLFGKIQHAKISYAFNILQSLWFRGVLCLFHYKRFLMKKENEYQGLINYQQFLSQYIKKAQNRVIQMKNREEIQQFYQSFYENFLKSLRKQSKISDLIELKEAQGDQQPQMSSLKILLHIQLNRTVEKSFLSLWKNILSYEKPFLRLHLVIDRQSFKFLEQQEEIVSIYAQIIKKILGVQLSGYALGCRFQNSKQQKDIIVRGDNNQFGSNSSTTILEYPQVFETVERNSLQQDQQLVINYKTEFIFDQKIREIINIVRQFYKECFAVLIQYEMYLPFIKLTTTQKMFSEEQGSVEQSFLKNIRIVSRYKQSIKKLERLVKVNIFEVDCSAPIRALQQRIHQIEYIIQQNYLNIIHQKIESVDSELNSLKIMAHNIGITSLDIQQTEEKLLSVKHSLRMLHSKTKKIAEMVMFCVDNRRKAETVVTCFCQLVGKKQELHRDIDHLFANLQARRPEVEAENQQHLQHLLEAIQIILKKAIQVQTTCFEFNNLLQYIRSLQTLAIEFDSLGTQISKQVQYSRHHSKHQFQDKFNNFQRQAERFKLMIEYWKQFYSFEAYFKQISKIETRLITFSEYDELSATSGIMIEKMHERQQEWWNKDKIGWKPIIHRMHEYYSKKLKTDVEICIQLKPVIKILTNRKIRERHWQIYGLETYRSIPFRQLIKLNVSGDEQKMLKMDRQVNFEYQIFLAYQAIQKQIKSYRLLIVDLNDSDILDIQNLKKCVQFLRNVEIDINELMEKDVGEYYDIQLKDLLVLAHSTVLKLEQWRFIEEKYIRFIKFHMNNDEYEQSLFSSLIELHRKLIKSFDIDNSVAFISKNIVMDSYLTQISEELKQLQTRIMRYLITLRTEYPRLYLLNDEQLFDFMSHQANIQKYLNKCFPQILSFGINQGSIERIGLHRELALAQPYYIQQMIGRVNTWVSNLEDLIKCRMKQFFKTNQILSEGKSKVQLQIHFFEKYPVQLAILDEQIAFTQQISEAVATGNLTPLQLQIENRIESFAKQKKDYFKLLLLILFRQQIACLQKEQDLHSQSFQWLKFPRFYRKSQLDVRVCFVNHQNIYGFNYLQKNQLIYTTNVFMGNCLIGPEGCGKTVFARNLSYLCGQQLIIFDPRSISHSESTINALINYFRVSSFIGNWLFLQRIDLLGESELKLIAQCISSVHQSIKIQSNKISLSGHATPLNRNVKFLMSCRNLNQSWFPGRLCVSIRPIWINYPNKNYLLEIYLQSKRVNSIQVGKILKFCCWLQNHREPSFSLLDWIRNQQDFQMFSSTQFFQKACLYQLYHRQAQQLLQIFRTEEKPIQQNEQHSMSLEQKINSKRQLIIYGQSSSGKTYEIISYLRQGTFLIINAQDYCSDYQFFSIIRSIKNHQQFPYLILKNWLKYYCLIKQVLVNFRVIFIESNLSHIDLGMVNCIDLFNFNRYLTKNEEEETTMEGIIGKILKDETQEIRIIFMKKTIFIKCLQKLVENLNARTSINQLYFNFSKIFKIMIKEQYEICVSFLFAVFWTFSFELDEKKLEQSLKQTISAQQQLHKSKFQKFNPLQNNTTFNRTSFLKKMQQNLIQISKQTFNNRITPLIQLIPLKKGKFVTNIQIIGQGLSHQICLLPQQTICMKSNFIFNLSIIRKNYPSTIVIEGRDWLTSLLKITTAQANQRFYNFGSQKPQLAFQEIFKGYKRKGIFYSIPKQTRIVIDDIHLCSIQTQNCLKSLGEYGFSSFLSQNKLKIYQTYHISLTFGSKINYRFLQKALNIVVQQNTITTISNQYIQSYCQKYMTIDRSIFSLLNLATNINRTFYDQEGRYYWFKNPIILLQNAKVPNLTEYIQNYIDYLCQILPMEKSYFDSQRLLLQLPTQSFDKPEQPAEVINTTSKFKIFYNETQIIEELISDNEVLQQIQSRRVQSIFFQKFIRKYFTKQILSYVRKVSNVLQFHHLVLLGDSSSHVEKILRYACKISGRKLLPFRNQNNYESRTVFAIYIQHCKEKELLQLQNTLKLKKNEKGYDKVRFVLTGCLTSEKVKKIYSQFPFLRSYFLNLVIKDKDGKLNSTTEICLTESNKTIEANETDCLQRLQSLQPSKQFEDRFKDEFIKVYQNYHQDQLINLEFYRKVSSEMMINIDLISKNLEQIPQTSAKLTEKQLQLLSKKSKNATLTLELKEKFARWQQKKDIFSELFYYKHERQLDNLAKLRQITTPLFNKMEKVQKKIQGLESVQFVRLKNNLKNNENNALVFPFHSILYYLNEKNDTVLKQKIGPFANSIFSGSNALVAILKNIHSKQNYDKQGIEKDPHNNSLVSTGMSVARLKYFLGKAEQIQQNGKRYEKVSLIYKILSSWFSYFHQVCISLKEYLDRQDEKDAFIVARLTSINQKYDDNEDINIQKQNLHVFVTESQNKINQINEVLQEIQNFNNSADLQIRKISKLKKFLNNRAERLGKLYRLFVESEYMKKVSSGVSLYFKHIQSITFQKALVKTTYNEFMQDRLLDPQVLLGVFTCPSHLFVFQQKMQVQSSNIIQLKIIHNLVEVSDKPFKLLEDRDSLIKQRLVEAAQKKGFITQSFQHTDYQQILRVLKNKITYNSKILLLHENVYYVELWKNENQHSFHEFIEEVRGLIKQKQMEIIYVTNYLPNIDPDFYNYLEMGKIIVTREKFMSDLSDIFNVTLQKQDKKQVKQKRGELGVIIKQRNSIIKSIMSSIDKLTSTLSEQTLNEQKTTEQIEREQNYSQQLQNYLINFITLQQQCEALKLQNINYTYLPNTVRQLIQQQLRKYYYLYKFTDKYNNQTNNQFFSGKEFYREWIALMKNLREERLIYFNRIQFRPVISEITVKNQNEDRRQDIKIKNQDTEGTQVNQSINPTFHKFNSEIFSFLIEKIVKNTVWLEKSFVYQYVLGVSLIQALEINGHSELIEEIFSIKVENKEQINQQCVRVLKFFEVEFYRGYELRFDKLTSLFIDTLLGKGQNLDAGYEVTILVYYYLISKLNQYEQKIQDFIYVVCESLNPSNRRTAFQIRYQLFKCLRGLKLASKNVLKLTPPLNLSINLDSKVDKQKLITIIQEEKYFLSDLVELLKIKSLSKKRDFQTIMIDMNKKDELVQTLKNLYRSSKQWVLLSNFSLSDRGQVRQLLDQILCELSRLPHNSFFRIFIILNKEDESQKSLYYNKYQINRIKGSHCLSDIQYYESINNVAIQQLFQGGKARQLMEQLIISTIHGEDDYSIAVARLEDLKGIYSKFTRKYSFVRQEDYKIYYKNIVQDIVRLGYFKKDHNQRNFYQFITNYFTFVNGMSVGVVSRQIQDNRQLQKQGICDNLLMQNARIDQGQQKINKIEKINMQKMQEYFKNINTQFAQTLKKQICVNNQIQADQQFLESIKTSKKVSESIKRQYDRIFRMKHDLLQLGKSSDNSLIDKIPLIRLMNNLKLKEICNTKKVDIHTSSDFWIFLTAFQYREIRQFTKILMLSRVQNEIRYSSGIGLFGNFVNTRDYATKLKVVLVDEDNFQQISICEEEVTKVLTKKGKVQGRFIIGIRKAAPQKITQLNVEYLQIEKLLKKYIMILQIGGDLVIELAIK